MSTVDGQAAVDIRWRAPMLMFVLSAGLASGSLLALRLSPVLDERALSLGYGLAAVLGIVVFTALAAMAARRKHRHFETVATGLQHGSAVPTLPSAPQFRPNFAERTIGRLFDGRGRVFVLPIPSDMCCEPVHTLAMHEVAPDAGPPGDAAVVLVLKRLSDAERDGDTVCATICDEAGAHAVRRTHRDIVPLVGHTGAASGLLAVAAATIEAWRGRAAEISVCLSVPEISRTYYV